MGFYIRKSVSFGGIRFNFSNSGVGVSAGIKGFRLGRNSKGTYVHIGSNGLYYRAAINSKSKHIAHTGLQQPIFEPRPQIHDRQLLFHEIESKEIALLTDSSSKELIDEISEKQRRIFFWPFAFAFLLVPKFGIIIALVLIFLLYFLVDRPRKTTLLIYDIDQETESEIQRFYHAFNDLIECTYAWHVSARAKVSTPKYYAGASNVINRTLINIDYKEPSMLKTNVRVPCIPVGKQKLYFLPDRVLITERTKVGAISYNNIIINQSDKRFIEEGAVSADSKLVGQTWRYVNKNGTPDRRFNNNRMLPILLYSELLFSSPTGLNELIQLSRPSAGSSLFETVKLYSTKKFLIEGCEYPLAPI